MAYPVSDPVFASDATFSSGPESGSNTKVDPGASYMQQGLVPGLKFVGPYLNFLLNRLCAWIVLYVKDLHNQVEFLNKAYTWTGTHTFGLAGAWVVAGGSNTITGAGNLDTTGTLEAAAIQIDNGVAEFGYKAQRSGRAKQIPLITQKMTTGANPWEYDGTTGGLISTGGGSCKLALELPSGCTITALTVGLTAPSGTITVALFREAIDTGTGVVTQTQIGANADNGVSTSFVSTGIGAVGEVVANTARRYVVQLNADAASQEVHYIFVVFTDPGPRNF